MRPLTSAGEGWFGRVRSTLIGLTLDRTAVPAARVSRVSWRVHSSDVKLYRMFSCQRLTNIGMDIVLSSINPVVYHSPTNLSPFTREIAKDVDTHFRFGQYQYVSVLSFHVELEAFLRSCS